MDPVPYPLTRPGSRSGGDAPFVVRKGTGPAVEETRNEEQRGREAEKLNFA